MAQRPLKLAFRAFLASFEKLMLPESHMAFFSAPSKSGRDAQIEMNGNESNDVEVILTCLIDLYLLHSSDIQSFFHFVSSLSNRLKSHIFHFYPVPTQ